MSKQASPTAIGAFLMSALALVVTGILFFGSGKFLRETEQYVLYFTGNARGLNAGSPVTVRGVPIGSVSEVKAVLDAKTLDFKTRVVVELVSGRVSLVGGYPAELDGGSPRSPREEMDYLVHKGGLRATLATQSLVTGQLSVEFDFYPGTPIQLVNAEDDLPELPTQTSALERVQGTLQNLIAMASELPIDELTQQLVALTEGLSRLVDAQETQKLPKLTHAAVEEFRALMASLNRSVAPVTGEFNETNEAIQAVAADVQKMLRDEQSRVVRLAARLEKLLVRATESVDHIDEVAVSITPYELSALVTELSAAARSVRLLADYLEQHPEALLRGKGH
jgi:paraquat-inducible protein B